MRANQETLVAVARQHGRATAGSWRAVRDDDGDVSVWHYETEMLLVRADNRVVPMSCGWRSMSDKCGVGKILRNVSGQSYAEVFPREWTDEEYALVRQIQAIKAGW